MYYHASQTKGIKILEPRVSNHNIPLIYFSDKRENVLVYLSNAIEKHCKETNFNYNGNYYKWASYGFNKEGKLQLEEYYPNATEETYKGVSAYIYYIKDIPGKEKMNEILNAYKTNIETPIDSVEYIQDAYEEIMKAVEKGEIILIKYNDFIKQKKDWLDNIIRKEYAESENHPEYKYFLESKFKFLKDKK